MKRFSKKEYLIFQSEFKKWQHYLGLDCYNIYFTHEKLKNTFADIDISQIDMVASVRLNSELSEVVLSYADPKKHARMKQSTY